jgi:hypothetical protein
MAAVALFVACTDRITAPAQCPELCPGADVEVVDTVLTGVVSSDTTFRGFLEPKNAPILVVSDLPAARTRVVARFQPRPDSITISGDTVRSAIGAVDSVAIEFRLVLRDTAAKNLRVLLYRLPAAVDTNAAFADLAPLFDDSLLIDSIAVEDTARVAAVRALLAPALVEPLAGDSGVVALGVGLRADQPTSITLASVNGSGAPPLMTWYVRAAAPRDTVQRTFTQIPSFDAFLSETPPAPLDGSAIVVGNLPATRALLYFDLPRAIVDSTSVIRATLLLTPLQPVFARPAETFSIEAQPVLRDFGGKSTVLSDQSAASDELVAGSTDTVRVEMGRILRLWRSAGDSLPRAVILRSVDEAFRLGEIVVGRGAGGAAAPRLRVTFVRPYRFGVP